jgi:hypothetical protein
MVFNIFPRVAKRTFSGERPKLFVYPICSECVNYIKGNNESYSRCKKIKYYNHSNDELEYEYADYVRRNRTVCGYEGKSFTSIYKNDLTSGLASK